MTRRFDQMRVDQVGSLLRPERLKDAFARAGRGEMSEADRVAVEDECIADLVAQQKQLGLPLISDGEFRRIVFMESFADVAGFERWKSGWTSIITQLGEERESQEHKRPEPGLNPVLAVREPATEKLRLLRNRPADEYRHLAGLLDDPGRGTVTLTGADRVTQGFELEGSPDYASVQEFVRDVVAVERDIVAGLVDSGCEYVHLDEPGFTAYVDPPSLAALRERGEDPTDVLERSIQADNALFAAFPDTTFGVHLCRGNRQSQWHREGHYDPIAEQLFSTLECDRLLLEYDTDRAGGFEPLRFVREGTTAVLGLISTKTSQVETVDGLTRRIEEASRYLPVERLAISPQCGFASVIGGNLLSMDDQWRKLEVMLNTAEKVWD